MNQKISKLSRFVWTYMFLCHNTLLPLAVAAENAANANIETKRQDLSLYTVQDSDTLFSIARAHDIDVSALIVANIDSMAARDGKLLPGHIIQIPTSPAKLPELAGQNLLNIAAKSEPSIDVEGKIASQVVRLGQTYSQQEPQALSEEALKHLDLEQRERAKTLYDAFATRGKAADENTQPQPQHSGKDEASYWKQQLLSQFESEANASVEAWLGGLGTVRTKLSLANGEFKQGLDVSEASADVLMPLLDAKERMLFTQFGLRMNNIGEQARTIANLGIGQRHFLESWGLGYNAFFDHDISRDHSRLGLGGEAWRDNLKLSSNLYTPISNWKASEELEDHEERAAQGFDIKAKAYLPSYPQLSGDLTYEQYLGDKVSILGNQQLESDPSAITTGVEYTPFPLLSFKAAHTQASGGQDNTTFGANLEWKFGASIAQMLDPNQVNASLQGMRHDLVERNNNIVLEYRDVQTLNVGLPAEVEEQEGQPLTLTASISSKYDIKSITWQESTGALLKDSNGNEVTELSGEGTSLSSITLEALPFYQANSNNRYPFSVTVLDVQGHEQRAEGVVEVSENGTLVPTVTLSSNNVQLSPGQTYVFTATVFDPRQQPVVAQTYSLAPVQARTLSQAGPYEMVSPEGYHYSYQIVGDEEMLAMVNGNRITVPANWSRNANYSLMLHYTFPSGHKVTQTLQVSLVSSAIDNDNDGLTDVQEAELGTDPTRADTDGDGLSDKQEVDNGTNPLQSDSDGDGLGDSQDPHPAQANVNNVEVTGTPVVGQPLVVTYNYGGSGMPTIQWYRNGAAISGATFNVYTLSALDDGTNITVIVTDPQFGPVSSASTAVVDSGVDTDSDGLTDSQEAQQGTDPYQSDTDGDGLSDKQEIDNGSDPLNPNDPVNGGNLDTDGDGQPNGIDTDDDGDGVSDMQEIGTGTNPLLADTDGDGYTDFAELRDHSNPLDPNSPEPSGNLDYDGDGIINGLDPDDDNDGLSDLIELTLGTLARNADTDGDGLNDGFEVNTARTDPLKVDTDGDGYSDKTEWDNLSSGYDPLDPNKPVNAAAIDTDGDGLTDGDELSGLTKGEATDPNNPDSDGDGINDLIDNHPNQPNVNSVTLSGTPAVGQTLSASPDCTSCTVTYQWLRNGMVIPGAMFSTYTLSGADEGQNISVVVNDGVGTVTTPGQSIAHSGAPMASNVTITGNAVVGETLSGSYLYSDSDNDPEGATRKQWYRNNSPLSGETGDTYIVTRADEGAQISFGVMPVATQGTPAEGVEALSALTAAVVGHAPQASNVLINGTATPGHTLTFSYSYSDAEGDLEGTSTYQWQRDGVDIAGQTTMSYQVVSGDLGTNLSVKVTPLAATGTPTLGTAVSSASVNVTSGTAPTVSNVNISGSPLIGQTLTANYTYADVDNDSEGATSFQWSLDGAPISGATARTYVTQAGDNGKDVTVTITPRAATGAPDVGSPVTSAALAVGSAPVASNVKINGIAEEGMTVNAQYIYTDAEGDTQDAALYQWYLDGNPITAATASSYSIAVGDAGKVLTVAVTPRASSGGASYLTGNTIISAGVMLSSNGERPPVANNVAVSGTNTQGSVLTATYLYFDSDADAEGATTFQWQRDGVAIAGATASTYTVTAADVNKTLTAVITPVAATGFAGTLTGAPVTSAGMVIAGSAPVASSVTLSGTPQAGQTLTASYVYSDADSDAQGTSLVQWYADDVAIAGATSLTYVVTAGDAGKMLTVGVTPVAATGLPTAGSEVKATAVLAFVGTVPVASNVLINGTAKVGNTLTGSYAFSDTEGDLEGTSTYQWYRNGVAIAGATAKTYVVVSADNNTNLTFAVTPVSVAAPTTGGQVTSSALLAGTGTAPVASALVTAGYAKAGQTMTAVYTYSDAESNAEGGTTFQWRRNGTAIAGATAKTYTLTAADTNQLISVTVTPASSTGAPNKGNPLTSQTVLANGDFSIARASYSMFYKADGVQRNYTNAVSYCNSLVAGGYSDWSLGHQQSTLYVYEGFSSGRMKTVLGWNMPSSDYIWDNGTEATGTHHGYNVTANVVNNTPNATLLYVVCERYHIAN